MEMAPGEVVSSAMSRGGVGDTSEHSMNHVSVPLSVLISAVDAMEEVATIQDPHSRRLLLNLIEEDLGRQLTVPEHPVPRTYLMSVVDACRREHNGLQALARALRRLEPDSRPVQEVIRRLSDTGVLDVVPADKRVALRDLIADLDAPEVVDAYLAAAGTTVRALRTYSSNAWEAFEALQAFNAGSDGLPPGLVFVERLAVHVDEEQAGLLRAWNDRLAASMGLDYELRALREGLTAHVAPGANVAYLVIQLDRYGREPGRYMISNWRQLDSRGWYPQRGDDRIVAEAEIEQHVEALITEAEIEWSRFAGQLYIEFVLPRPLLNLPVERWVKESDTDLPTPLGIRYPLVIRSLERMRRKDWHRVWRQRWEHLRGNPGGTDAHWCRPDGDGYPARLERKLMSDLRLVSLILSSPPQPDRHSRTDEVLVGLRTGLPVIFWDREDCTTPAFQESVLQLIDSGLSQLPERAKGLGSEGLGPGPRQVVILLDDPNRLLEDELPGMAS
jgi:vWA-MoxR associated protein C-terminal domain/vWA-MoxR associated protein middle region 0/Effector-associated domain 2